MKEKYPNNTTEEIKFYIKYSFIVEEIMHEAFDYALNNYGVGFLKLDRILVGLSILTKHNIPYEEINIILAGILIGIKQITNDNIAFERGITTIDDIISGQNNSFTNFNGESKKN